MKNTGINITVPHLFLSHAFSVESKPSIISSRFIVHETFQIDHFNSKIFNNAIVQFS